jgi:hypothetical protein
VAICHHDGEVDANGDLREVGFQDLDPFHRRFGFDASVICQGLLVCQALYAVLLSSGFRSRTAGGFWTGCCDD